MTTDCFTGDYSTIPNSNVYSDIILQEKEHIIYLEKDISPISFNIYDLFIFQNNEDTIDPRANCYSSTFKIEKKNNKPKDPEKQKKIMRYKLKRKKRLQGNYEPYKYKCRQKFANNRQRIRGRFVKIN